MDLRDKIVTQLLCNFIHFLPAALGQLILKETNVGLIPMADFNLKPFERLVSQNYEKEIDLSNGKRISKLKEEEKKKKLFGRRKEDVKQTSHMKNNKFESLRRSKVGRKTSYLNANKVNFENPHSQSESEIYTAIQNELKSIKNQIKSLKKVTDSLKTAKNTVGKSGKNLCVQRLPEIFEKVEAEKEKTIRESKIGNWNRMSVGSGFGGMNNVAYNNRYQIDAIFIINRLSEEKENSNSKLNGYKETEDEVFNESTGREMKELLVQTLNNLSRDRNSEMTETTEPSLTQMEMSLIDEVRDDFYKTFRYQNVSLQQIHQMSKIIDFVERYHGVAADLATSLNPKDSQPVSGNTARRQPKFRNLKNFLKQRKTPQKRDT